MDRTLERLTLIAEDLGWLRRRGVDDYALERACQNVEVLDAMLRPTAAQLHKVGVPLFDALAQVDRERRNLRGRLGLQTR